jgi:hypothetical protein
MNMIAIMGGATVTPQPESMPTSPCILASLRDYWAAFPPFLLVLALTALRFAQYALMR